MAGKLKLLIFSILLIVLLCAGCVKETEPGMDYQVSLETPEASPITVPETAAPVVVSPDVTEVPDNPAAGKSSVDYKIDAVLDYYSKQIEVDQTIQVRDWLDGIHEMALVIEVNRYTNGFELHTLEVDHTAVKEYSLDGNQLRFNLPENLIDSGSAEIHLTYTVYLPQIPPPSEFYKPQPYGYTDRQVNLVDWYAFVPPMDENKDWIIHKPPIFGEAMVYPAADYEINLTIENYSLPLIVAASSPAEQNNNTYSFSLKAARTFAISISPYYSVVESKVNGISVRSYAFNGYENQNRMALQNAAEALALFSELYGPLPLKSVSIVQADFLDGMEYDGLYFVSKAFYDLYDGTVQGYLSLITVHEMAHQWWFGVVGNDQALEPWLDEGFATFGELQYIERFYPELEDWWWSYRVNYYDPKGPIDLSIYDYSSFEAYRNAVYLRGALFLNDIRAEIGDEAFDRAMRQYYEGNQHKIAHKEDFIAAFEKASKRPSEELLRQYFEFDSK